MNTLFSLETLQVTRAIAVETWHGEYMLEAYSGVDVDSNRCLKINLGPQEIE